MRRAEQIKQDVGRVEQMRRHIAIVMAIVPLVLAAWTLAGTEEALAQAASSDQYSSAAASEQYSSVAASEQYQGEGANPQVPFRPDDPAYPGPASVEPTGVEPASVEPTSVEPTQVESTTQGDPTGAPIGPSDPTTPSSSDTAERPGNPPDTSAGDTAERPGNPPDTSAGDTADYDVEGDVEEGSGSIIDRLSSVLGSLAGLLGTGPAEEPGVDGEVAQLEEQVDGTPVDVAGKGEVFAGSAADPQEASSQDAQVTTAEAETYLTAVLTDADRYWTAYFGRAELNEPLVNYDVITPEEPGRLMACTGGDPRVVHDTPNAYYCSVDDASQQGVRGTIYLPATTMLKTWNGDILGSGKLSRQAGDFAAAALAAHEFGHHVQDEIATQKGLNPPTGKNFELIADCFAGNWATSAYYQGYLEAGDLEEAVYALEAIGDDPNYPSSAPHGTPAERMDAFKRGYFGADGQGGAPGDPSTCVQYYWH